MRHPILILTIFLSLYQLAHARAVRSWSYEELYEASDVVAIIEPQKISTNDAILVFEPFDSAIFQGLTTTCSILTYLKAEKKHSGNIEIYHFRYKNRLSPPNGASFVTFPISEVDFIFKRLLDSQGGTASSSGKMKTQFIAFLKFDKDGRLVPTTGQYDAEDSFKLLLHPGSVLTDISEK